MLGHQGGALLNGSRRCGLDGGGVSLGWALKFQKPSSDPGSLSACGPGSSSQLLFQAHAPCPDDRELTRKQALNKILAFIKLA